MHEMNPKVDDYINRSQKWAAAMAGLRAILLEFPLEEDFKWGVPCYTFNGSNVVLMHEFKEYCALLFVKGALLKDPQGVLVQQTENVQAARQARFSSAEAVAAAAAALQGNINEAIQVEIAGLKVDFKKTEDFAMAEEFQQRLDEDPALQAAFEALTPGRQRAYLLHFSAPKQAKTRAARVEKCAAQIMAGKGLND